MFLCSDSPVAIGTMDRIVHPTVLGIQINEPLVPLQFESMEVRAKSDFFSKNDSSRLPNHPSFERIQTTTHFSSSLNLEKNHFFLMEMNSNVNVVNIDTQSEKENMEVIVDQNSKTRILVDQN